MRAECVVTLALQDVVPPISRSVDATTGDETSAKKTTTMAAGETTTTSDSLKQPAASFLAASIDVDDETEAGVLADDARFPVCLGAQRSSPRLRANRRVTCSLCLEQVVRGKSLAFRAPVAIIDLLSGSQLRSTSTRHRRCGVRRVYAHFRANKTRRVADRRGARQLDCKRVGARLVVVGREFPLLYAR